MTTAAADAGERGLRPGLVVVTHGGLAFELVRALERIVGPGAPRARALSIGWDEDLQQARKAVDQAIRDNDGGAGVLILTDMFGGTATNLVLSCARPGVEIVTGANLPMLIKFSNLPTGLSVKEVAAAVREQGQKAIALATGYLEPGGGA